MIENEMEGKDGVKGGDIEARRVRFENERMTRRGALRKFGFMAGMAVFATLSVDDLARIAAKKMQDNAVTKGIGDTLAKEFQAAGVALANDDLGHPYGGYYMKAGPWDAECVGKSKCMACCDTKHANCTAGSIACRIRQTQCTNACTDAGKL